MNGNIKASTRRIINSNLRNSGYPLNRQEMAIQTVMKQGKYLTEEFV